MEEVIEPFVIKKSPERGIAVLRVNVSLELDNKAPFSESCRKLLESPEQSLVLDLTSVEKIFSLFLGTIADLHMQCEKLGKKLTIIANERVMKRFSQTDFTKFLKIRVVEG